jgi:thioredoxin reductase
MGVRGTPRKLGIPGEDLPKVTYNLLEPEQYQRMHISIVGAGNAAVEAAQALAERRLKNKVTLLVRGKALDRANQENKDKVIALAKQGLVKICFESTVKEVHKQHLVVDQGGKLAQVPNSYLFIFAGAEMPFAFLQSLGIKIEKKFGEARPK